MSDLKARVPKPTEAQKFLDKLCDYFKVPHIKCIKITSIPNSNIEDNDVQAQFLPDKFIIQYLEGTTLETFCHELGHYINHLNMLGGGTGPLEEFICCTFAKGCFVDLMLG